MIVVVHILEDAERCLLCRNLLNHELGDHLFEACLQAISADSKPFEVMQELREFDCDFLLTSAIHIHEAALINFKEPCQYGVLHLQH